MSRLSTYLQEETNDINTFSMEEADDLIEALEHFLGDEEDISMEGGFSDMFKERKESIKDKLQGLFKGAGSVQEGFTKTLIAKKNAVRELDGDETKVKLTGIASYIYDADKRRYRTDLAKAIGDDLGFIDDLFELMSKTDDAMQNNIKVLARAPRTRGDRAEKMREWQEYWEDVGNPKVLSAGAMFLKYAKDDRGLYGSYPEMSLGFKADKRGESFSKQTQFIKLRTGKDKAAPSAQRDIEEGLVFSKRDMETFIDAALKFSDKTADAVKLVNRYGDRYHPRKGDVQKELINIESEFIGRLGVSTYMAGISVITPANVSIITTMDKLPMQIVARNLKLLRIFIRFTEQFF